MVYSKLLRSFYSPNDPPCVITRIKSIVAFLMVGLLCLIPLSAHVILDSVYDSNGNTSIKVLYIVCMVLIFILMFPALSFIRITKRCPDWLVITVCGIGIIIILLADTITYVSINMRLLSWIVVILDLLLLCRIRSQVPCQAVLTTLALFQLIMCVERSTHSFRIVHMSGGKFFEQVCGCLNPPCKQDYRVFISSFVETVPFFLDFYLTKKFALTAQSENEKLHSALQLSFQVVNCLVDFNLYEASLLLKNEENSEMRELLLAMLHNLKQFRPYLPDSIFEVDSQLKFDASEQCVPSSNNPPGLVSGKAAIAFTDIKSSTKMWDRCPGDMKIALKLHNDCIRKQIQSFKGYEVKTIGDSFMIAFEEIEESVLCCLSIQNALSELPWPEAISDFCVRISTHFGEIDLECNSITKRYDYFGSTVNRAARMEGAGVAGTVTVIDEDLSAIGQTMSMDHCSVVLLGHIVLNGFQTTSSIYSLLPNYVEKSKFDDVASAVQYKVNQYVEGNSDVSPTASRSQSNIAASVLFSQSLVRFLKKANATVAKIDLKACDLSVPELRSVIMTAISCIERTNGTILSLYCTTVIASWNCIKECKAHLESGFRFGKLLNNLRDAKVAIGISGGRVISGEVGTAAQKFVTVIGACVRMAELLQEASLEINTFMLHASSQPDGYDAWSELSLRKYIRPIDYWAISDDQEVTIYQCRVTTNSSPLWGTDYDVAFETRDARAIEVLLDNSGVDDPIVATVLRKLRLFDPRRSVSVYQHHSINSSTQSGDHRPSHHISSRTSIAGIVDTSL